MTMSWVTFRDHTSAGVSTSSGSHPSSLKPEVWESMLTLSLQIPVCNTLYKIMFLQKTQGRNSSLFACSLFCFPSMSASQQRWRNNSVRVWNLRSCEVHRFYCCLKKSPNHRYAGLEDYRGKYCYILFFLFSGHSLSATVRDRMHWGEPLSWASMAIFVQSYFVNKYWVLFCSVHCFSWADFGTVTLRCHSLHCSELSLLS